MRRAHRAHGRNCSLPLQRPHLRSGHRASVRRQYCARAAAPAAPATASSQLPCPSRPVLRPHRDFSGETEAAGKAGAPGRRAIGRGRMRCCTVHSTLGGCSLYVQMRCSQDIRVMKKIGTVVKTAHTCTIAYTEV